MDNLRKEAEAQGRIEFERRFKKNSLEVVRAKAKKDALKLSGLQKMRAINRARNLTEAGNSGSAFSKFSEYTQKNLQRTEENKKRTEEMRKEGAKMRGEELAKRQGGIVNKPPIRKIISNIRI